MEDLMEIFALRNSFLPITHTPLLTMVLNCILKKFPLIPTYTYLKYIINTGLFISTPNLNILWYIFFKYFLSAPQYTHFPFTLQFINTNLKQVLTKYPNTLTNTLSCTFFLYSLTNFYNRNYIVALIFLTFSNYYKFYVIFLILLVLKYLLDLSNKKENNKQFLFLIFLFSCSMGFYLKSIAIVSHLPYFDCNKTVNTDLLIKTGFYKTNELKSIIDLKNFNKVFSNEFKQANISDKGYESVLDRSEITLNSKLGYFSILNTEEEVSEEESEDTFQARTNKNLLIKKLNKLNQKQHEKSESDIHENTTEEIEINELTERINSLEKRKLKKPGNSIKITETPIFFKITKLHNYVYKNFYQKAFKELLIRNGDEIKISIGNKNLTVKNSEKRFSDVKFIENKTNKNCIFVVETIKTDELKAMTTYFRLKNAGKYLAVTKSGDLKLSFYAKKENTIFCVEGNEINDIFLHHGIKKIENYRKLENEEREGEYFYNMFLNQKVKGFMGLQLCDFSLIFLNFYFILKFLYLNLLRLRYEKSSLNKRECFYAFISSLFLQNLTNGKFFLMGIWVLKEMNLEEVVFLCLFFAFHK